MRDLARGYIASGEFNGYRAPQHLQNQVVKNYCDSNNLVFILSRAEYWINGSTQCQLWAALNEGYRNIVFFSLWQLPIDEMDRKRIYEHCTKNQIILHFATERLTTDPETTSLKDIEILYKTNLMILSKGSDQHLESLSVLL
jgi:sporadic carbohydrate cluster protein (TIGR04323 family)